MYFNRITLDESVKFTIKNLIDLFTIPDPDPILYAEEKLKRVKHEFYAYYDISKQAEREFLRTIEGYRGGGKESLEAVDLEKIDRFHHLHLRFKLVGEGTPISNTDFMQFYTYFYRQAFDGQMPSPTSTYTLPYFVDGRYLTFIIFDEKKVHSVLMLASANQLDLRAPIYLVELPISTSIFTKV